jgi:hypothetical protein
LLSQAVLLIPNLNFLGIVWMFIALIDLPASAPMYALGWKHPGIAVVWVVVAGTLYWYLLSRGVEILIERHKIKIASGPWPPSINQPADAKEKIRS